jgi:hypothetical protein
MQKLQKSNSEYKLTEIGEIPNDWQVKALSEIGSSFTSGGTPSTCSGRSRLFHVASLSKGFL